MIGSMLTVTTPAGSQSVNVVKIIDHAGEVIATVTDTDDGVVVVTGRHAKVVA
jgi:hypothetical protein